ncbi:hypothetical protein F511_45323 [Dorcoceras hygrometricum]|uniref:Uncharacterized protein n=1 Tax=Dorcoceras hygrometricum TaxID=472368 RepID=A0A2Z6ZWA6_9LAMI|nr:hypothetical protein F511_45323 [Dorcoceras hygrometricum]
MTSPEHRRSGGRHHENCARRKATHAAATSAAQSRNIVRHRAASCGDQRMDSGASKQQRPAITVQKHRPASAKRPMTGRDARPARISFASSSAQRRVIIGRPMCDNRTGSSSHESAAVRNECAGYRAAARALARACWRRCMRLWRGRGPKEF